MSEEKLSKKKDIRFTSEMYDKIEKERTKQDRSFGYIVRQALEYYFEQKEKFKEEQ